MVGLMKNARRLGLALSSTIVVIFVTETLIMLVSGDLPVDSPWGLALFDSALLSIVAVPFLYVFVFRPLAKHPAERERVDQHGFGPR